MYHGSIYLPIYVFIYVSIYLWIYLCIYVCIHVYMYVCIYLCIYVSVYLCICAFIYAPMHLCICVSINLCYYLSIDYLSMILFVHSSIVNVVCMYVSIYLHVYLYIYRSIYRSNITTWTCIEIKIISQCWIMTAYQRIHCLHGALREDKSHRCTCPHSDLIANKGISFPCDMSDNCLR